MAHQIPFVIDVYNSKYPKFDCLSTTGAMVDVLFFVVKKREVFVNAFFQQRPDGRLIANWKTVRNGGS